MRITITKTVTAIVLLIAVFFTAGCTAEIVSEKTPSNYGQLYPLLAKPVAEACQALALEEEAVTAAMNKREPYGIGTVNYAGMDWKVELLLEGKIPAVYGFQYTRHYDSGNIQKAAEDAVALVKNMEKHYGQPGDYGELAQYTVQQLQEMTANHTTEVARWELADQINSDMQAYFQNYIADAEGEHIPENLIYVMDLTYMGNSVNGVYLKLEYKLHIY